MFNNEVELFSSPRATRHWFGPNLSRCGPEYLICLRNAIFNYLNYKWKMSRVYCAVHLLSCRILWSHRMFWRFIVCIFSFFFFQIICFCNIKTNLIKIKQWQINTYIYLTYIISFDISIKIDNTQNILTHKSYNIQKTTNLTPNQWKLLKNHPPFPSTGCARKFPSRRTQDGARGRHAPLVRKHVK